MALNGNLTGSSQFFDDELFYNDIATTSLRTDHITAKNVSRTPGSESNKRTFTFSTWLKRSHLDYTTSETVHQIFSSQVDGNDYFAIFFQDDGKLYVDGYHTQQKLLLVTNRLFRDTSAWMNLVVAVDTTQGTAANRIKIYVNGVQETSFSTATYPSQNYDTYINDDVKHTLGSAFTSDSQRFGGYFADTNLIDGTQLTPASFGETKNGVWIPIDTGGLTFGTNGFRLKFNQTGVGTASTSTIGADTSGNNNHYASTNIVASDCAMSDSPENNFNTFSPLIPFDSGTLTEGNLKSNNVLGGSNVGPMSAFGVTTGKWFCEMYIHDIGGGDFIYAGAFLKRLDSGSRFGIDLAVPYDGSVYFEGDAKGSSLEVSANGHIYGFAVDCDNFTAQVYKTVGGTYGTYGPEVDWSGSAHKNSGYMGIGHFGASGVSGRDGGITVNYGQDPSFAGAITAGTETPSEGAGVFKLAPPSGFLALCTANLPEPTIGPNSTTISTDHFETILYSASSGSAGAGSSTAQDIGGLNFKPDWVWIKGRSYADHHALFDSARGVGKYLLSSAVNAEATQSDTLDEFRSDGFGLGADSTALVNYQNNTYVAWNWKANGGTATATINESGNNPAAVVQANPTAGFSLITYTGTGADGTIAHGLSAKPAWYFVKNRDVNSHNWLVWHDALATNGAMSLNLTSAAISASARFTSNEPTTSVFYVGSDGSTNADGEKFVAYCFAEVEGYSKFGSFTGNGLDDGPFINLGFRPAFVMSKRTDAVADWQIMDVARNTTNVMDGFLFPNGTYAETSDAAYNRDFLSNGFKVRGSEPYVNADGGTFIYMAFAEAPFKYANAR